MRICRKPIECYWPHHINEINGTLLKHNNGYYLNKSELQQFVEKINNALKYYDEINVDGFNKEIKQEHEEALRQMQSENKKYIPTPPKKKHGFVYFFTDTTNLIKIGLAKNVKTRFKTMQIGNPTLKIIHCIETKNVELTEYLFHEYFKSKRLNGEWFKLTEKDLAYIKKGKYSKEIMQSIKGGA